MVNWRRSAGATGHPGCQLFCTISRVTNPGTLANINKAAIMCTCGYSSTSLRMRSSFKVAAALLCLAAPALAVDWKALKPQGYVSDFAGVIDAPGRTAIEAYASSVQKATGAELAFVMVRSLEGEPIEDVANDLFHAWGIGKKGEDNGALVLISIADRKSRLEVGGGLGGAVPDGMAGLLLDDMRPALRQGSVWPGVPRRRRLVWATPSPNRKASRYPSRPCSTVSRALPRTTSRGDTFSSGSFSFCCCCAAAATGAAAPVAAAASGQGCCSVPF